MLGSTDFLGNGFMNDEACLDWGAGGLIKNVTHGAASDGVSGFFLGMRTIIL